MKSVSSLFFSLSMLCASAQSTDTLSRYVGKYQTVNLIVQIAISDKSLVLLVPGAPLQELIPFETNKFRSDALSDEIFHFIEKNGKIQNLTSIRASGESLQLTKISDHVDNFNGADSLLVLKKSTEHFIFLYSKIDTASIDIISKGLENNYEKILADFKIENLPITNVRIYPDLKSFHSGINFPDAPDQVMATAFGKNDFRMVSPNYEGIDTAMLMKHAVHEFTHCVHLNIVYAPNNPRWLWEGVAMYEADWFLDPKEIDIIRAKQFPKLSSLNNGMEYMLGYVIIEAVKNIWGFDKVLDLIKKKGDVQAVLQLNENEFEKKVFEHIYQKYILN